ncbi:hypothetical protein IMZ31_20960 (plasmid) [Pontibacillus sp. ALD_SL1]|uniref:hypothetical protein n=1 Tax=Pontibacillus sp. ALD_SL1 TaxID=2777185 RepID=UPI001A975EAB|nr:hypothetical protein [Pontibacillus sp. ALD_SL1]QST03020.1 hypothetical protein IMZ31_20960 [Pontibacillus sp. ALD_SL1]
MFLLEIGLFLAISIMAIVITPRILWIVFFFFVYRFWELVLTYEFLSSYISFEMKKDYYLILIIITIVTYGLVMLSARHTPILQYVFCVVMILYTLRVHSLSDVFLFKDYLEARGMWDLGYWKDQLGGLFDITMDDVKGSLEKVWAAIVSFFSRLADYVKGL